MKIKIPVSAPAFHGNERNYLLDCFDSSWISSNGPYIGKFEDRFAAFCGAAHAVSCANGTVALHLALLGAGVGPGDEVIVPDLTFVATGNAVLYCGARPVLVDVDPDTWNIDPAAVRRALTERTRAILAVHLLGHPAEMDELSAIADERGIPLIEDAAEAHGATYRGRRAGVLGRLATFSFYGNKIVTTGEGGMVVTDDGGLAARIRQMKGQGQDFQKRYWFPMLGFNYRLTNMQAAIGLAQLEDIEWHLSERRRVAEAYRRELSGCPHLKLPVERAGLTHAYWMFGVVLEESSPVSRDRVMERLATAGIETRPFFYPLHTLPIYRDTPPPHGCPVASSVASRGICLPTWSGLSDGQVGEVSRELSKILSHA